MVQTGLIFDLILGAVLQDWHFNFARQIHDGLTKRSGNGLLGLMVIILVESVIVAALLLAAVLTIPANPDYAPAAAYDYQPHQLDCGRRPDGGWDQPFQEDLNL